MYTSLRVRFAQLHELLDDSNYWEINRKILAGFNEGNMIPLLIFVIVFINVMRLFTKYVLWWQNIEIIKYFR